MDIGIELLGLIGGLVIGGLLGLLTPRPQKKPETQQAPVPVPIENEQKRGE